MRTLIGLLLLLGVGCGSVNETLTYSQVNNSCQAISSVHFFTAQSALICFDKDGKQITPSNTAVQVSTPSNMIGNTVTSLVPVGVAAINAAPKTNVTTIVGDQSKSTSK